MSTSGVSRTSLRRLACKVSRGRLQFLGGGLWSSRGRSDRRGLSYALAGGTASFDPLQRKQVLGEGLARLYQELHGMEFVALRYTAVYGERQHRRAVMGGHIAETCERLRRGEPPIIDGGGEQVQDYVYVGDVARANLLAMESAVAGEGFNIVSGVATSQKRIVEIATEASGSTLDPIHRPLVVTRLPPMTKIRFSREKARRLLGWEPQVSIEEGISRMLRWVDEKHVTAA